MLSRRSLGVVGVGVACFCALGLFALREPLAQAAPRVPSTAETQEARAVIRLARKAGVSGGLFGNLEQAPRLASFYARLDELEGHRAKADVRIVQFGDSHTASDYGTSVARARLVARFGDGGRGFIPIGHPYRRLFQAGEAMGRDAGFTADGAPLYGPRTTGDGFYGLAGFAMESRLAGAWMTSELTASADRLELAYLAQPGGGSFDVSIDGQKRERVTTAGGASASAFRSFTVARGAHTLEARAVGDGPLRIYGVRLDDDAVGITFDSFGMNGARASTPLAVEEASFGEQLARVAPSLVVIAYGTNESGDSTTTIEDHGAAVRGLALRVKKSAPGSSCLVLGPPDRGARTLPKLLEIIAAQRAAADDSGCAFFDQLAAMGGAGAIASWSRELPAPRARRDLVHLTRAGYAFLAEALVRDLSAGFESWKAWRSASDRP